MKIKIVTIKKYIFILFIWLFCSIFYILYNFECILAKGVKCSFNYNDRNIHTTAKLYNIQNGKGRDEEVQRSFHVHQFNLVASDQAPLNRSLPDYRFPGCRGKVYHRGANVSIIIAFHNEAWSALMRTLWSIIIRTPLHLITEVILVDDASYKEYLGPPLDREVERLPLRVRVQRVQERRGLVHARLLGATVARGSTLVFLDSHCECSPGWLPPLLHEIVSNRRTIASPLIDVISYETFEYKPSSHLRWGAFNWLLNFKWYPLSRKERNRRRNDDTIPIRTPTIAGGLFAVDKAFFWEQGAYDAGMQIWGGENLELSFRTWMCGGRLLIVPCSRVGHVFRKLTPYTFPGGIRQVIDRNNARLAEVWMDRWKNLFYAVRFGEVDSRIAGDLEERLKLRQRLKCHHFEWYLRNVYPHSAFPLHDAFIGHLRHTDSGMCLQVTGKPPHANLTTAPCRLSNYRQLFLHSEDLTLQNDNQCLAVHSNSTIVSLSACQLQEELAQQWKYQLNSSSLQNVLTSLCLHLLPSPTSLHNMTNVINNNYKIFKKDINYLNKNDFDYLRDTSNQFYLAPCSTAATWSLVPLNWNSSQS